MYGWIVLPYQGDKRLSIQEAVFFVILIVLLKHIKLLDFLS